MKNLLSKLSSLQAKSVASGVLAVAVCITFVSSSAFAEASNAARFRTSSKTIETLLEHEGAEIIDSDRTALTNASALNLLGDTAVDESQIGLLENVSYSVAEGGLLSSNGKYIRHPVARGKMGIDVSEWNKEIDWATVKNTGLIDYAIIRCGYGQNLTSQDDKNWVKNVAGARRVGMPFGVYIYSYAYDVASAVGEAEHVLRCLNDVGITPGELAYPIYYDLEESSMGTEVNRDLLAAMATAFCDRIESAGYAAGIYANMRWFNNFLTDPVFNKWTKWVAQYPSEANFTFQYTGGGVAMWQCTSSGVLPGIGSEFVDVNFQMAAVPNYAGNTGNTAGFINRNPYWSGIFPDLLTNAWYFNEVKWANDNDIITGFEDGLFRPNDNLDRQQLAMVLWRLAGEPVAEGEDFIDSVDSYAAEAIRWARGEGIVTGFVEDGKEPLYKPSNAITRQEFATMLGRYAEAVHGHTVKTTGQLMGTYPDSHKVSSWAYDAFGWVVDNGIVTGKQNIWLAPVDVTPRCEAAAMLYRFDLMLASMPAAPVPEPVEPPAIDSPVGDDASDPSDSDPGIHPIVDPVVSDEVD